MRRKWLLIAGAAASLVAVLIATTRTERYHATVLHTRIVQMGQQGKATIDIWYDPAAELLRAATTGLPGAQYVRCPGHGACAIAAAPGYRWQPLNGYRSWAGMLAGYFPAVPPAGREARRTILDGQIVRTFSRPLPGAPLLQQRFWVRPRGRQVVQYEESSGGNLVLLSRFATSSIPPGTLPDHFFTPPRGDDAWLSRLRHWLGDTLRHR